MAIRQLTMDELNRAALDQFVYQPVSREMIKFLADAAHNVISCDSTMMPSSASKQQSRQLQPQFQPQPQPQPHPHPHPHQQPPALPLTPPKSPESRVAQSAPPVDNTLPTLEEFITQLVVSSNVQVPTLMSTLVYLTRLKSKLQPMARGLRCTTHRIFLASLILAAKYLNDSSPKNKHWANYTFVNTDMYSFGFNRTEVNLMEKQLLFLLEWELRISEQDLYRELDSFLEPLRIRLAERHSRKMRHREEKRRQQEMNARYPIPPASRGPSRSRNASPETVRSTSGGSVTPPGLTYSSSASSYASSIASSRQQSRSATPLESNPSPYMYEVSQPQDSLYDSPVEVVLEADLVKSAPSLPPCNPPCNRPLSYEMSAEQYQQLQDGAAKKRCKRGMWGRLLGGAVTVR
ncbi:Cyclin Pcl [Metarhizium rileyi]|uniref:Cyclin Pcl n=1 Tax=Metarhizium rileyi (strain RCEF 4871) TaxID=1649241 RepID=A0A167JPW2_METRR|nr:Cyclin Pcl [Metarhizium rileyi RCEF 4871]